MWRKTISCILSRKINAKGGIPKKDKEALTDAQAKILLDTILDLPPYVFVMIGLYSGLRREEILGLQWDCVFLDVETPYLAVRRAWHSDHNRPVVTRDLKTPAAKRDVPIPQSLVDCLLEAKETEPGQKCVNRENVVYCLDFKVTPHQLRHTYITNLTHAGVDPKTVQYLAGHENSQVTMDIYAKAKYNRPEELSEVVNGALKLQTDSDESGESSKMTGKKRILSVVNE